MISLPPIPVQAHAAIVGGRIDRWWQVVRLTDIESED